jgi:hypothetical protein
MARLKNIHTGAVISCADEKVALMGDEWVSVDVAPAPKSPRSRSAKK